MERMGRQAIRRWAEMQDTCTLIALERAVRADSKRLQAEAAQAQRQAVWVQRELRRRLAAERKP